MARGRAFDSDASGSVQTPPAAQSPTVQASSDPRITLSLVAGHIYPSSRAARQILKIIKLQLHKEGYTWDAVPQKAKDFYWEEFQHRAGTSSSDPAPATDRHVSKSQQQPLPTPNPDAADDTLVTPLGATSHPAGTPPGDPTSGDPTSDPADEQQHRFDFRPF
ncbi:hypothetical protein JCGZ_22264 [Jatropha curcas]|uniref:Uncharacterized protein n=1 Tax=Jatropha curcas TaxID=180498 RepID=A0A067K1P8_JATCU|nr:hypothetical protein JCGZ_22264 [Jatropha curcas]